MKKKVSKKKTKKANSWSDLTKKQQEFAKEKYMEYQSIASIAKELDVPRTTIQYHANKYWDVEREMMKAELFQQFSSTKKQHFIEMSQKAMHIISKSLSHLAARDNPPTPREAKDATTILEALDKITRLDDGKPTEITEEKVMELKDIEAIAELVPFKTKGEIVYKEDEEDEKSN